MRTLSRAMLWLHFYEAALPGYCAAGGLHPKSPTNADRLAAESADLAMNRYEEMEKKELADARKLTTPRADWTPEQILEQRQNWAAGTFMFQGDYN